MTTYKHTIETLDKTKRYVLPCGHNNAGGLNLYPFKTFVCFTCGLHTDIIKEVTPWAATKYRPRP